MSSAKLPRTIVMGGKLRLLLQDAKDDGEAILAHIIQLAIDENDNIFARQDPLPGLDQEAEAALEAELAFEMSRQTRK